MTERKRLISICVPVFNEESNIEPLYSALLPIMDQLSERYEFELLFTDNHSTDRTFEALEQLAQRDVRVRAIRFSRNFGFQRSIATSYANARGDAAVQIDCDLQDPPALILDFVRKWEEGYKVVYGVRNMRREGWGMNVVRKTFYRIIDWLSEDELPLDAGDFRLVDRCILDELQKFEDNQPYLRGAIAALGFDQIGIPYNRAERQRGKSKFSFGELIGLALDGILNHSVVPLRIATYLGLTISVITFLGLVGYAIGRLFLGKDWPPGFATTIILILGSLSLNALFLGIIGEYLGRIYRQVKRRPLTIVERELNPVRTRADSLTFTAPRARTQG
ncbi:MAG TPA: glycosyltransferase family 2 protein [Terriglobales bacterium]|nr:glycosyltransferase family 2 protein [Terriglobales bacterium]